MSNRRVLIVLRLNQCFGLKQLGYKRKIVSKWLRGLGTGSSRRRGG
jgi:hypothetical protein